MSSDQYAVGQNVQQYLDSFQIQYKSVAESAALLPQPMEGILNVVNETVSSFNSEYNLGKEMGKDMLPMIKAEADGAVNALDLRICYASAKLQKWHVLPTQTLVRNIGIDGTGAHCDTRDPYLQDSLSGKTVFRLDEHITPNKRALREYKKFYSPSLSLPRQIKRLAYKMRSKVANP